MTDSGRSRGDSLKDGEGSGEEGDLDAGDGLEAEEAVFYLGEELGVGGFVGGGSEESEVGDVAGWEAGDGCAGCVGVGGEVGGADEVELDDVQAEGGGVAVAESLEEVGVGHCLYGKRPGVGLPPGLKPLFFKVAKWHG